MASFNCCGFRRRPSADLPPIKLVDNTKTKGRFLLSNTGTPTSTRSPDTQPIHEIFAAASADEGRPKRSNASAQDYFSDRHQRPLVDRKESIQKLNNVAKNLRKRMSRESGVSKRSSNKKLKGSLSLEDMNRRRELKRAMHQRVQSEINGDMLIRDCGYDEDAIPIRTPRNTCGRHEGEVHMTPKQLSRALQRSSSPSPSKQVAFEARQPNRTYSQKSTTATLSRMLTQRASQTTNVPAEDEHPKAATVSGGSTAQRSRTVKKYVFNDADTRRKIDERSPSPLERSNTVIHIPSSSTPIMLEPPEFLNTPGKTQVLYSEPLRVPSTNDTAAEREAERDRRLSLTQGQRGSTQQNLIGVYTVAEIAKDFPEAQDKEYRPPREQWLSGASGVLDRLSYESKKRASLDSPGLAGSGHGCHCDPSIEELGFGGVDGSEGDPPPRRSLVTTRSHSEGSDPLSVHLYNMRISERLASTCLSSFNSLPHLQATSQREDGSSSNDSRYYSTSQSHHSMSPRRQVSSSGFSSAKVPTNWGIPKPHDSSSAYTSQSPPISIAASRRSSLMRDATLSDRLRQSKRHQLGEDTRAVPPSRSKSVDAERLDRLSVDTRFHSSNESLTNREVAAAAQRISPMYRAKTLPKNSRFREEFREDLRKISAEIASTNPPRRKVASFDGSGELIPPGRNGFGNSLMPPTDEDCWQKALREHAEEDAAIARARPGSMSMEHALYDLKKARRASKRQKSTSGLSQGRSSTVSWQEDSLQARLGAYQLSAPPTAYDRGRQPLRDLRTSSAKPAPSWARFPSHDREQRSSSPAGLADNVFVRDFATESPKCDIAPHNMTKAPNEEDSAGVHDSMQEVPGEPLTKRVTSSIERFYRTQSLEFHRTHGFRSQGHRSSISEGGLLEYPELEVLAPLSSPLPVHMPIEHRIKGLERKMHKSASAMEMGAAKPVGSPPPGRAKQWSELYQDCVVYPDPGRDFDEAGLGAHLHANRKSEDLGPLDKRNCYERKEGGEETKASTHNDRKAHVILGLISRPGRFDGLSQNSLEESAIGKETVTQSGKRSEGRA